MLTTTTSRHFAFFESMKDPNRSDTLVPRAGKGVGAGKSVRKNFLALPAVVIRFRHGSIASNH